MTLQQLHYVITVSETGSLSKAVEILYVSQPSLTGAVRELEKEIGITVFNRTPRGMTLTSDGAEFLSYARRVYGQFEELREKYDGSGRLKKKFCVSTQHYSFAVKAFVEMVKHTDTSEYELAVRETRTKEVIDDVSTLRSEIGILYLNDFNRLTLGKLFRSGELEFHKLIDCAAYVYLWKEHPLARNKSIRFEQLKDYPCLSFEQGDNASFYFAEEILSTCDYPRIIKACDRATMLNLMVGLDGYTLCSGIICEELNGGDYAAIPLEMPEKSPDAHMEIGYIVRKNNVLSSMGKRYIEEIENYLRPYRTLTSEV